MKASTSRIHVIDAIRGFAVLGILIANIQSWSGYKFIPFDVVATLPYFHLDALFLQLHEILVDGKFYAIFSILFGAGFGIQYERNREKGPAFISKYRKRTGLLLIFGIVHTLCWSGDILGLYALLAFVLVMLRKIAVQHLLPVAVALLLFFLLPQVLASVFYEHPAGVAKVALKTFPDATPLELTASFGTGGWADVLRMNLHNIYWRWHDFLPNGRISRVLGLFLLGFYLARSGYFTSGIYSKSRLAVFLSIGILATATAVSTDTNITQWAVSSQDVILKGVLVLGQICQAMAYMSMLAMIYASTRGESLLSPFTLIGRMAFTSYLLQTVIGMTLFYGVGFGYWGSMGLAQLWLLALLIYTLQVLFCALWLKFYQKGPVEWLWASLTAGRMAANRRS
ncbi:DUF418 domain-containing protein [Halioglobus maricola]|uniref:DUF418 domain-containing protein n=1 Tax=Halioglobus maricola TaxID=2601894 RepID=A0A5P9NFS1_9GAMM|nr:DUF418 domain-containing protein [Halioglobus maricola]QFU74349.1 DUF418 domain-containing protein [Halioglobus maricola]